jgi:hypothetical protein
MTCGRMASSRLQVLWLIPIALAVHNAEEAMMFPSYLPRVQARLPAFAQALAANIEVSGLRVALLWATLIPIAVLIWVTVRPSSVMARWCALAVLAVVAINVISHVVVAATLLRGYSPGLLSAVTINAPLSVYLFRRAARERWLPERAWRGLLPAALLIHGPGLVGLLLLARRERSP